MMKRISVAGELSEIHTNHCIRATSITMLHRAGLDANAITAISGHKSVDSLKSCISGPSQQQQKAVLSILRTFGNSEVAVVLRKLNATNTVLPSESQVHMYTMMTTMQANITQIPWLPNSILHPLVKMPHTVHQMSTIPIYPINSRITSVTKIQIPECPTNFQITLPTKILIFGPLPTTINKTVIITLPSHPTNTIQIYLIHIPRM